MQRAKLNRCTTEATSAWCDVISRGHHDRVDYSDRCSGFAAKTCFTFRRSRMIGSTLSEGASAPASRHGRSALRMMMVGLPGFEPGTSCPPDKRANQAAPQPAVCLHSRGRITPARNRPQNGPSASLSRRRLGRAGARRRPPRRSGTAHRARSLRGRPRGSRAHRGWGSDAWCCRRSPPPCRTAHLPSAR